MESNADRSPQDALTRNRSGRREDNAESFRLGASPANRYLILHGKGILHKELRVLRLCRQDLGDELGWQRSLMRMQ